VKNERNYTTITIPKALYEKISDIIKDTGFSSVSEYVVFVLRETMADIKNKNESKSEVIKKLKALGYMWLNEK